MTATASAPGGRNGTSRPSFRPGADACTPSPTTRNRTRRASRGTGPRRAQTRAPRGHPLRQIRAAVPGFAVLGGGWDRAAILNQHARSNAARWQTPRVPCRPCERRPGAPRRGTGHRRAREGGGAWPLLRPVRTAVPGFSVLGDGWDRAEILHRRALGNRCVGARRWRHDRRRLRRRAQEQTGNFFRRARPCPLGRGEPREPGSRTRRRVSCMRARANLALAVACLRGHAWVRP